MFCHTRADFRVKLRVVHIDFTPAALLHKNMTLQCRLPGHSVLTTLATLSYMIK